MAQEQVDRLGRPFRTAKSRVRTNVFKQIISRGWYLLVPVFGVVFAQDAYVRPHLVKNENTVNVGRVRADEQRDSLLAITRVIQGEADAVQAEIDSTWTPQVALYRGVLDSLVAIRREYDSANPKAQAKVDSLQAVLSEIQTELQASSAELTQHQLTIDQLKIDRRTLRDSIGTVADEIQELADVYDRLAFPDNYRKNTALIPGPGNYPNRDELPVR